MTSSSLSVQSPSVQSPAVPAVLGIDISKLYFDAALVKTTAKGKVGKVGDAKPQRFDNTPEGFKHLQAWLKTCHVQQVHACLEATGRYGDDLAVWLHTQDHVVSIVNPAVIHAYANVQSRRNKTDALDAALIARYCLNERPHAWTPPAQETLDLQALLKRLEDLKTMRQQESNRLASIIPCPQAEAFIQAHIDFLDQQIAALDAAVKAHIKTVPTFMSQFKLLLSIPGIGPLTAMRLIAFDLLRFEDADAAVAMAGLNPSQHHSGTSCHHKTRLSKRGHAGMRKALYMPALTAITYNPLVRALADRLAAKSKHPMLIIGAAMRKLLRIAFGVLKSARPFDPAFSPLPSQVY